MKSFVKTIAIANTIKRMQNKNKNIGRGRTRRRSTKGGRRR